MDKKYNKYLLIYCAIRFYDLNYRNKVHEYCKTTCLQLYFCQMINEIEVIRWYFFINMMGHNVNSLIPRIIFSNLK